MLIHNAFHELMLFVASQNKECLGTEGVAHLCGPVGRGSMLAAGLSSGRLLMLDCRAPRSLKVRVIWQCVCHNFFGCFIVMTTSTGVPPLAVLLGSALSG